MNRTYTPPGVVEKSVAVGRSIQHTASILTVLLLIDKSTMESTTRRRELLNECGGGAEVIVQ